MPSQNDTIPVTDHAVIRYLERVKNVNIKRIKRKIGNREVTNFAKLLGEGDYPVNNEFKARVVNKKVVTVIPIK